MKNVSKSIISFLAALLIVLYVKGVTYRFVAGPAPYETPNFTVRFPANVPVHVTTEPDGGKKYVAGNDHCSWGITYLDDVSPDADAGTLTTVMQDLSKARFDPGFFISPSTAVVLGGSLPAQQMVAYGQTHGMRITMWQRMAIQGRQSGRRSWLLVVMADDQGGLSENDADMFFNSFKLKE